MATLGVLAAPLPVASAANTYVVLPCAKKGPDDLRLHSNLSPVLTAQSFCGTTEEARVDADNHAFTVGPNSSAGFNLFEVPSFAEIQKFELDLGFSDEWARSSLSWEVRAGENLSDLNLVERAAGTPIHGSPPVSGHVSYVAGSEFGPGQIKEGTRTIDFRIVCLSGEDDAQCPPSTDVSFTAKSMVLILTDSMPPSIQTISRLAQGATIDGARDVEVLASDSGSGVYDSAVLSNGQVLSFSLAPELPGEEEDCRKPFSSYKPCRSLDRLHDLLDTTTLTDGSHVFEVLACDATEFNCDKKSIEATVHNAPANTKAPSIEGPLGVAAPLKANPGEWAANAAGVPFSFSTQWLRCPEKAVAAGECKPIPNANAASYTPTKDDLGSRLVAEVKATLNAPGQASERAFSPLSGVISEAAVNSDNNGSATDKTPPTLSAVSLTHARFRVVRFVAVNRPKPKGGAVLKLTSSEAGLARLTFSHVLKAGKTKPAGTLNAAIVAGTNRVQISGRIGKRAKPLPPGRYKVAVSVRDAAGNVSAQTVRPFTILR